ncbi:hypothetical protein HDU97_007564 [Phlyctochytrium planicorne]|nr:hypothetical protein HDU97_007564 [Phlyctochytrium planicorne]
MASSQSNRIRPYRGTFSLFGPDVDAIAAAMMPYVPASAAERFQKATDGFHMTIFTPAEAKLVERKLGSLKAVEESISGWIEEDFEIFGLGLGKLERQAGGKDFFAVIGAPALQVVRVKAGFGMKKFHVTLGMEGSDAAEGDDDKGPKSLVKMAAGVDEEASVKLALEWVRCSVNHFKLVWPLLKSDDQISRDSRESLVRFSLDLMQFCRSQLESLPETKGIKKAISKCLIHSAIVRFYAKLYTESLADALEAVDLLEEVTRQGDEHSAEWSEALVRCGDAAVKLEAHGVALRSYWMLYHRTSVVAGSTAAMEKLKSHAWSCIKKLWKSGYASLELLSEEEENVVSLRPVLSQDCYRFYVSNRANFVAPGFTGEGMMVESRMKFRIFAPHGESRLTTTGDHGDYRLPRFFSWLVPFVLAGMSTPKTSTDIRALKELGVGNVITLTEEEPLPEKWFEAAGVRHYFWPTRNYHPPHTVHADRFLHLLIKTVHGNGESQAGSAQGSAFLVHCGGGKGRAGSLIATYLVRFGLSVPPLPCEQCKDIPENSSPLWCLDPECAYGANPAMNASDAIQLLRRLRPGSIETERQEKFVAEYVSELYSRMGIGKRMVEGDDDREDEENEDDEGYDVVGNPGGIPKILVLCGFPASGKSWFASKLAEAPAKTWTRLCQDDIEGSRDAFERAVSQHGSISRLVLDRCNPTAASRKSLLMLAGNPSPSAVVHFDVSKERCLDRARRRLDHPTLDPFTAGNAVKSFVGMFEPPTLQSDKVDAVYRVRSFRGARKLLERFGVATSGPATTPKNFFKYPRTRHLYDIGGATRDDLVVSEADAMGMLKMGLKDGYHLTVEEKVDGANVGFRFAKKGASNSQPRAILCQNRSKDSITTSTHPQFAKLSSWIHRHRDSLESLLMFDGREHILFGEWMHAKHSILYDALPDVFIAFDLFDVVNQKFVSRKRFASALEGSSLSRVPVIQINAVIDSLTVLDEKATKEKLLRLLQDQSAFSSESRREGVVFRVDEGDWLMDKAKIVRSDFMAGNRHWSKNSVELNGMASS